MHGVTTRHAGQQFRSLFASIEILAAAAVSNALVLGSFVRDRGAKKQRFRFGSTGGHSSLDRSNTAPRRAITAKDWGSDADLVGDVGIRLDPKFTKEESNLLRPAPKTKPLDSKADEIAPDTIDQDWNFSKGKSVDKRKAVPTPLQQQHDSQPSPGEVPSTPRGMSFFDVGGLLGDNDTPRIRSRHQSIAVPQSSSQASMATSLGPHAASVAGPATEARRGSQALLQDIGGLLSPSPRVSTPQAADPRPEPSSQHSGLIEALQSTPPNTSARPSAASQPKRKGSPGLQDVGGLLS